MNKNSLRAAMTIAYVCFAIAATGGINQLLGLDMNNCMIRFDPRFPEVVISKTLVTGLPSGEELRALTWKYYIADFIAVGQHGAVYSVAPSTGAARELETTDLPLSCNVLSMTDDGCWDSTIWAACDDGRYLHIMVSADSSSILSSGQLAYAAGELHQGEIPKIIALTAGCFILTSSTPWYETRLFGIDANSQALVYIDRLSGEVSTVAPLDVNTGMFAGLSFRDAYFTITGRGKKSVLHHKTDWYSTSSLELGSVGGDSPIRSISVFFENDIDVDGVPEPVDECPNTIGALVDDHGCAIETSATNTDYSGMNLVAQGNCSKLGKCRVKGSLVVQNNGSENGGRTAIDIYLSDDALFGSDDLLVSRVPVSLKAGQSRNRKFEFNASEVLWAGKWLIARIDGLNAVGETNENNNQLVFHIAQ